MIRHLLAIGLATGCTTSFEAAPDTVPKSRASVAVAGYLNDPAIEARVMGVLNNHSIPIVAAVCSLGCTLHIDADRADEARAVLRGAAAQDHLQVVIYDPLAS